MMRYFFFILCSLFITTAFAQSTPLNFDCKLSDAVKDDEIDIEKTNFSTTARGLYLFCNIPKLKMGDEIKGEWVAVDTNNAVPANYNIDSASVKVTEQPKGTAVFTAKFSISKPSKDWPAGTYKVNVYINNHLQKTIVFTIGKE